MARSAMDLAAFTAVTLASKDLVVVTMSTISLMTLILVTPEFSATVAESLLALGADG